MRMLDEILDEPNVIKTTFYKLNDGLDELVNVIKESKRIYVIGNGTSYHAAMYFQYIFQREGLNIHSCESNELRYCIKNIKENDLCIAISQSGENRDILNASKFWLQKNKKLVSFVNRKDSSLSSISLLSYYLSAGDEFAVPATKSYVASLVALFILYGTYKNDKNLKDKILHTSKTIEQIISEKEKIKKISETVNDRSLILGTFLNYITAREAALKLIETSGVFSLAYPTGEIFHGPVQILDKNMDLFLIKGKKDMNLDYIINKLIPFVNVITIGNKDVDFETHCKYFDMEPIVNIVPFQLMSYYIAVRKGFNPDKPSRLNKVVK